jgi:hypothetical protein
MVPVITIDGVEHHMGRRIYNIELNGTSIKLALLMHHVGAHR